ncbi:hypothetical protein Sjap_011215 [Stephania japonica]|uniref:Uncharacterized protein n=1 Tax=Stephania japonica TaxID=461633 RepID=A0AAP0JD44_9MAGN
MYDPRAFLDEYGGPDKVGIDLNHGDASRGVQKPPDKGALGATPRLETPPRETPTASVIVTMGFFLFFGNFRNGLGISRVF